MDKFLLLCSPDSGSKRQNPQDLSQFKDKTLDARSSIIRGDSIRLPPSLDNCIAHHQFSSLVNAIPNGINNVRHDYPNQSYQELFRQSFMSNPDSQLVTPDNLNLIPDGAKAYSLPIISPHPNSQPYQNYPTQSSLSVQQPFISSSIPHSDTSYEYKAPTFQGFPTPQGFPTAPPPPLSDYNPVRCDQTNPVISYTSEPYRMDLPLPSVPYTSSNQSPSYSATVNPTTSFSVGSGSPGSIASGSPGSVGSGSPGSVGSRHRNIVEGKKREIMLARTPEGEEIVSWR